MKHLLPLTAQYNSLEDYYWIEDKNGILIATHLTKEEAEFFVTAANAHYPMLQALKNVAKLLEELYWNTDEEPWVIGGQAEEIERAISLAARDQE